MKYLFIVLLLIFGCNNPDISAPRSEENEVPNIRINEQKGLYNNENEIINIDLIGSIGASSELVDGDDCFEPDVEVHPINIKYGVQNAFDGDIRTTWAEGVEGPGMNEAIYISVSHDITKFNIFPGYGKDKKTFYNNNRVKKIKLSFYSGINPEGYVSEITASFTSKKYPKDVFIELKDHFGIQTFDLPSFGDDLKRFEMEHKNEFINNSDLKIIDRRTILKVEIIDVYKGEKYDDTCISEIFFNNRFFSEITEKRFKDIIDVYTDETDNRVLIDTKTEKEVVLEDEECIFQIAEISKDKKWVSIIQMPAEPGARAETIYLLLNTASGKVVNTEFETMTGVELSDFFSLEPFNKDTMLEYSDKKILLSEFY